MYQTLTISGTETGHTFTRESDALTAAADFSRQAADFGIDSVIYVATTANQIVATFKDGRRVKAETV